MRKCGLCGYRGCVCNRQCPGCGNSKKRTICDCKGPSKMSKCTREFYLAVPEDNLDSCYKQHTTEAAAVKEAAQHVEDCDVFIVRVVAVAAETEPQVKLRRLGKK